MPCHSAENNSRGPPGKLPPLALHQTAGHDQNRGIAHLKQNQPAAEILGLIRELRTAPLAEAWGLIQVARHLKWGDVSMINLKQWAESYLLSPAK